QNRSIDLMLTEDGSISGRVVERARGQGARERMMAAGGESSTGFRHWAEHLLNRQFGEATVSEANFSVDSLRGGCTWSLSFTAPHAAQLLGGHMIALRPFFVGERDLGPGDSENRTLPVRIEAEAYRESVTVRLPAGFTVDDLPSPTHVKTEFGAFDISAAMK